MVELALKGPEYNRNPNIIWPSSEYQLCRYPIAPGGETNVTFGGEFRANLDPKSVMRTMPPIGIGVVGVSVTVMVTDVAPATVLLRVMAG